MISFNGINIANIDTINGVSLANIATFNGVAIPTPFISSWKTDNAGSASTTIIIPTSATGTYNCTVSWGDGNISNITTYNDAAWTHVYSIAGTYTVKIYGTFNGIVFANIGDKAKLLNISQWGQDFKLGTTQGSYLRGTSNLTITATDNLNLSGTTSLAFAFAGNTSLTTIPSINSWDWSGVANTQSLFNGATSYNQNISFNTSSSWTTATGMFTGATIFNGTISFSSVAGLTASSNIFANSPAFNQPVTTFNNSPATTRNSMFLNATAFNQDVSGFNITAMTNAGNMLTGSAFAKTNYNLLLDSTTGWPSQATIQNNVSFHAGTAHYDGVNAIAGRATLTTTYTWTISDGGTP